MSGDGIDKYYRYRSIDPSPNVPRAQILTHLLEAEKSTFRGEPSFQRSECTAGLTATTILLLYFKDFSVLTV